MTDVNAQEGTVFHEELSDREIFAELIEKAKRLKAENANYRKMEIEAKTSLLPWVSEEFSNVNDAFKEFSASLEYEKDKILDCKSREIRATTHREMKQLVAEYDDRFEVWSAVAEKFKRTLQELHKDLMMYYIKFLKTGENEIPKCPSSHVSDESNDMIPNETIKHTEAEAGSELETIGPNNRDHSVEESANTHSLQHDEKHEYEVDTTLGNPNLVVGNRGAEEQRAIEVWDSKRTTGNEQLEIGTLADSLVGGWRVANEDLNRDGLTDIKITKRGDVYEERQFFRENGADEHEDYQWKLNFPTPEAYMFSAEESRVMCEYDGKKYPLYWFNEEGNLIANYCQGGEWTEFEMVRMY